MVNSLIVVPLISSLVTAAVISGIWIGAYYIGVKPNQKSDSSNSDPTNQGPATTASHPVFASTASYPVSASTASHPVLTTPCIQRSPCEYRLVESIPWGIFTNGEKVMNSTSSAWLDLVNGAESSIEIASFYWSLLAEDTGDNFTSNDTSTFEGRDFYNALINAGKKGISIKIAQNTAVGGYPETANLEKNGWAQVRSLNFTNFEGSGILHTKTMVVDRKHFYVGSANYDWRSLTQVKELGAAVFNCPCLADDVGKILDVYWQMGVPNAQIPDKWPDSVATVYGSQNPLSVRLNQENDVVYFSASPPDFRAGARTGDIDAILNVINTATQFVHIEVMDYAPTTLYMQRNYYWPLIDDALRNAAFQRQIHVRLLMGRWVHTYTEFYSYLYSLQNLNVSLPCLPRGSKDCKRGTIEVRLFEVPPYKEIPNIPYARVNHAKFMVTDNTAYIGTSNWSGDYFISTGGIGMIIQAGDSSQTSQVVQELNDVFIRDWNSNYSTPITDYDLKGNPINSNNL